MSYNNNDTTGKCHISDIDIRVNSHDHSLYTIMKDAYIDYSNFVIKYRSIPCVLDGLKIVQRRIIYMMKKLGMTYNSRFRKSANVVGNVLATLHPHGDSAVYNAMVHLAQPFATRYPLVKGQGNFGSLDGDRAAAMRYTEAKLNNISSEFFHSLEKNTVPFTPNYDNSGSEPKYLPTHVPHLLINGTTGIAVGVSTNIPPHNLTEICNAAIYLLDHSDANLSDLLEFVQGPDLPCGGTISSREELLHIYEHGKGSFTIEASYDVMDDMIIFHNVPFQTSKLSILEKIQQMIKDKEIPGCRWVRDESDRHGTRIVIKMQSYANSTLIINHIFSKTTLRTRYSTQMYALDKDLNVKLYNLKTYLQTYLNMQEDVLVQNTIDARNKCVLQLQILLSKITALDNVDEIISVIRSSHSDQEIIDKLTSRIWVIKNQGAIKTLGFKTRADGNYDGKFTVKQAKHITSLTINQLSQLAWNKITQEINNTIIKITDHNKMLSSRFLRHNHIKANIQRIIESYGDNRRTKIQDTSSKVTNRDLIESRNCVIMLDNEQYIRSIHLDEYRQQHRGGLGRKGEKMEIQNIMLANTKDYLLFFSEKGILYGQECFQIPIGSHTNKGRSINNIIPPLEINKDNITYISSVPYAPSSDKYVVIVMSNGLIRKHHMSTVYKLQKTGRRYKKDSLNERIVRMLVCNSEDTVLMATKKGRVIHIKISEMSVTKSLNATGRKGCNFKKGDYIIDVVNSSTGDDQILTVFTNGKGRISYAKEYRLTSLGATGVSNSHKSSGSRVAAMSVVTNSSEVLIVTNKQQVIRIDKESINTSKRKTLGTILMHNAQADPVTSILNF